jgi:chloramphenicol 3-O phosphotransferase
MKHYIAIFVAVLLLIGAFMFQKNQVNSGTVIVLNGPSGSGKSSIQKEFQKLMMPNLWIKVGIDNLFDNPMPEINAENLSFWQSANPIRWVETSKDEGGNNVVTLYVGEQGDKVAYGMNSAIADYARNGCNVIVDYIAYNPAWFADLKNKLQGIKTYYVAVQISLETLEKREEARGTSPKGHARSHYFSVYGDNKYDLYVDSEKNTAVNIAQQIKQLIVE